MAINIQAQINTKLVQTKLQAMSLKNRKVSNVSVVYEAYYAIYVHEVPRPPTSTGTWKYLEGPARDPNNVRYMQFLINQSLKNKESLLRAITKAARYLLNESKRLVPVDTGYLKSSGKVVVGDIGNYVTTATPQPQ